MAVTYAREALDYNPDTGELRWRHDRPADHFKNAKGYRIWKARYRDVAPGKIDENGYLRLMLGGRYYRAHRVAWMIYYGVQPPEQIDHINGDRNDNRIANLRAASSAINARNRKIRADNKSGVSGVFWRADLGRWTATIGVGCGQAKALGAYDTKAEAIAARRAAEIVLEYHENHGRASRASA